MDRNGKVVNIEAGVGVGYTGGADRRAGLPRNKNGGSDLGTVMPLAWAWACAFELN
jgi:hypothetical protein